jgi:hypothetical protein
VDKKEVSLSLFSTSSLSHALPPPPPAGQRSPFPNRAVARATSQLSHAEVSAVNARLLAMARKHFPKHHSGAGAVRGRSLIETLLCEYDAEEGECEPGIEAMKAFRPATPDGQVRLCCDFGSTPCLFSFCGAVR